MSDKRGKPRVISCAARNVAAYAAGTTPLSFRLSECNERTKKSLAIIIFTLRFLHFTHFVRFGRKERSDGIAIVRGFRAIASMTLNKINNVARRVSRRSRTRFAHTCASAVSRKREPSAGQRA